MRNEPQPKVTPLLKLKVEYKKGLDKNYLSNLKDMIKDKMAAQIKITPEIELIEEFFKKNY